MKHAVGSTDKGTPAGADAPANANESGVGARQGAWCLPPQGGGYQHVYTEKNDAARIPPISADPRIAELRRVGIPRVWITIAQTVGFDAFVGMWRVLMQGGHVDDRCRVVVPNYARYLRFQRNQLIRQLVEEGFGAAEICEKVQRATGEIVSESHIRRAAPRA